MNKIDFILLFDATDANPNGDPDGGNMPRIDAETGHGIVTDVCLKRKIRNYVQLTRKNTPPYEIFVKEKAILNEQQGRAYSTLGIETGAKDKKKKQDNQERARAWMCANFYDIRTFGAVMSTGVNCGQVRGPVQVSFARSVTPVAQLEYAITRCAVAKVEEADSQGGDNRTMGRKFTVPYGLYVAKGTVNPFLAEQTGFGEDDLKLLIEALTHMFDFDASAARPAGSMAVRKLILFRHESELGNAPAHKLYECLDIKLKDGVEIPRGIADYDISLSAAPRGVSIEEVDC